AELLCRIGFAPNQYLGANPYRFNFGGICSKRTGRNKGLWAMRKASIERKTTETKISASVDLDGKGAYEVKTGIGFLDHMLEQLARHSLFDIKLEAKGDLHIDSHHTTEDSGIALGQAVAKALGDRKGIRRYASLHLPMDEALTRAAIDVS